MRIIAGRYGGRVLKAPKVRGTRPMTEKVRGALFDILGPLHGLRVLDLYAGSGALGFEALSRGANSVTAVERASAPAAAIRESAHTLACGDDFTLAQTTVETWLAQHEVEQFDLIFAMPPYALLDPALLGRIGKLLSEDGIMVVEYPRQAVDFGIPGLELQDKRSYGDPSLAFYRQSS